MIVVAFVLLGFVFCCFGLRYGSCFVCFAFGCVGLVAIVGCGLLCLVFVVWLVLDLLLVVGF